MSDRRFYEDPTNDARRSAPAALRNVGPIGDLLAQWLPETGTVLELASGTGEHGVAFAKRFPAVQWQPSDTAPEAVASIAAWRGEGTANLLQPLLLDAATPHWPIDRADAIVAINLVHISPWATALGLLDGAARLLPSHGSLIFYGPWIEKDVETAASNMAFDADLRARNPDWGLRSVEQFTAEAALRGLSLHDRRAMPANNIMLHFTPRNPV